MHLIVFMLLNVLARLTLVTLATSNTFSQFLFPFQFFDCVFIYTFFSLRTAPDQIGSVWVVQIALLQLHTVLRNSGTYVGLSLLMLRMLRRLAGSQWQPVADDPLVKLPFCARVAIQYDVADITAIVLVPALVTLCVWRDGFLSLQGTGILVRSCDLPNVWLRFLVLLLIKPLSFGVAQCWLRWRMSMTMLGLGRRTLFGHSSLAEKLHLDTLVMAPPGGKRGVAEGNSLGGSEAAE
eukprot:CAMPEP_0174720858 /NCGR_PEP_ID=MMETSP1094-20130205/34695_1 /TAXON_ID=156173 /ORGANISM="Chrysochromulina brevifilum, Strain UTEX LB 985" /LENGTH=236 /DNA_ID=CAMNT_0015921427 /DNA_START=276 /DNA_END=983 /DNA_ORIENTATION=+